MTTPDQPARVQAGIAVLVYAAFAVLGWRYLDQVMGLITLDPEWLSIAQANRLWLLIATASLPFYVMYRTRLRGRNSETGLPVAHDMTLTMALLGGLIVALVASAIAYSVHQATQAESLKLQAIADLKTQELTHWLKERLADARLIQNSTSLRATYRRWHDQGDLSSREQLIKRLSDYTADDLFDAVSLLDERGQLLWRSAVAPQSLDASDLPASQHDQDNLVHQVGPYLDAQGHSHLDFIVPMGTNGPHPTVVLHTGESAYLSAQLGTWPSASASGEVLAFRNEGGHIIHLNKLRFASDVTRSHPQHSGILQIATQLVQTDSHPSQILQGTDYRGHLVYGVGRNVPGTPWYLLAKVDQSEFNQQADHAAGLLTLAGTLALFMALAGVILLRQRQQISLSRVAEQAQAEQLRALQLLSSIADGSSDAIYAKDLQGHYIFCNREMTRLTGKTEKEILGQDDQVLFPASQLALMRANDQAVIDRDHIDTFVEELSTTQGTRSFLATKGPLRDSDGAVIGLFGIARDITQLKNHEGELRDNEERLRLALQASNQGWFDLNVQTGDMTVSPEYARMLGYNPGEFIGTQADLLERLHPDDKQMVVLAYENYLAGHTDEYRVEARQCTRMGTWQWILTRGKLVQWDGEGRPQRMLGTHTDVSARKTVEETLSLLARRADALLELPYLAEKLNEMDFLQRGQEMTEDLTQSQIAYIHFVNEDGESIELVAWSKRTLQNYCHATHDRHYPVSQAGIWADALRYRQPVIFNDYASYPDKRGLPEGHAELQRLISVPVIENGRVVMLAGVGNKATDYTDLDVDTVQLMANEMWRIAQHRRSESIFLKLSQAVEQSPESIVITDVEARIEYVNEALLRTTGYRRDELIGQNPRLFSSGKTSTATYTALWHALKHELPWKGQLYNRHKDGSEYVEFVHIAPLRQADGRISHYVAVKEDITEKKRLGEELDKHRHNLEEMVHKRTRELAAAKDLAEAANLAKSRFLANMSHEIRTPMNAIIGLTHILRRDQPSPQQFDRLNKIDSASRHLLTVINDILDLSKIEAGRMQLETTDFHLGTLLNSICSIVGDAARDKGLQITVENSVDTQWLRGDPTRLRQALLNYASNSIKFTEQGTITLRAGRLPDVDQSQLIRFAISDTGIGIPADKLSRLFQPFEQADTSTTRKYGGTGLGLTITRRLAGLMGGEVGADSTPGEGSTFWFTARFERGEQRLEDLTEQSVDMSNLPSRLSTARILLAEDNLINQEVARELLSDFGVQVDIANNGREALEKVCSTPYDLVLMDMHMPVMDGLAATRAIHALAEHATLPIIAMSASAFDEDRDKCRQAGMSDFVSKPVEPDVLFATLLRWLPTTDKVARQEPSTQEALPDALKAIAGLDCERGLRVLNGHAATYLRLLRRYATEHSDDMALLREHLAQGKSEDARRLAHSLKGSSGNLGVTGVQHMAAELEGYLKEGHDVIAIERLSVNLENELMHLKTAILAALPDATAGAAPVEVDWSLARQVLSELESLLADSNTEANQLVETHAGLLKTAYAQLGNNLVQQVEHFLYPEALETLKQLAEVKGDFADQPA